MKEKDNFLENLVINYIKRSLIFALIVFCVLLFLVWYHLPFIASMFFEPSVIKGKDSAVKLFNNGRNYVELQVDFLYDAYYDVETITTKNGVETGRELTSFFTFVEFEDDSLMLIELPYSYLNDENAKWENITLKGVLKKEPKSFDVFNSFSELVAENLGVNSQEVHNDILVPIYLDTTEYNTFGLSWIVAYGSLIVLLISSIYLIYIVIIIKFPKYHKLCRQLKKHGNLDVINNNIQREYSQKNEYLITNNKYNYIFKTYIVSVPKKTIRLTSELIWAYKKTISTNNGKSYCIMLYFKDNNKPLSILVYNENEADRMATDISKKLPIICEYNKELKKMYKNDRQEFLEYLENHKKNFESQNEKIKEIPNQEET